MRTQPQLSPGLPRAEGVRIEPIRKGTCRSISCGRNDPRLKWQVDGQCGSLLRGYGKKKSKFRETPLIGHADQQSVITEIAERVRLTKERLEIYLLRNRLHEHTDWPDVFEDERHVAIVPGRI